ncbi:FliM/FliN family flagellar motor C-terminal domain-containing protein [Hasllibacter sp. MH4015]|uniref:FliM/FliN family flagellar motor switch protein n=1 Tax=Hasllibacter sp. MH4015 TaxID=2854029 RepID=UPI001CD62F53|nr:FliM/FliN family flagellar motor C-terminal domain-containing protein [Hasllibacter sp. MH4015]
MSEPSSQSARASAFHSVPIEIRVCVGKARPRLSEMLSMDPDTVLPLDRRIEDKVSLWVGDKIIAEGELVELDGDRAGQLAVRVTDLMDGGDAAV